MMTEPNQIFSRPPSETVTREQLYELVWQEPMLRVAEKFSVTSSYLARVCTELRVPRPLRGYWAKLEHGKSSPIPPLPPPQAGDALTWRRGEARTTMQTMVSSFAEKTVKIAPPKKRHLLSGRPHELVAEARPFFMKGRVYETGLLYPSKRNLVDIVVSEALLDDTLVAASALFNALVARGHRVVLTPTDVQMRRAEVDEREVSKKNHYRKSVWSPGRPTVAYVGGVPIGLTFYEMTEEVEVVYQNGQYLPIRSLTQEQTRRLKGPSHWTTTNSLASGRRCLQVYSPHWKVKWTKQWRESKPGQLSRLFNEIVRELEEMAPVLERQILEAEAQAVAQRQLWDQERERERVATEARRRAKARMDSRNDLLIAIASWDEVRRIHSFFECAETESAHLEEADRSQILDRIKIARELVGPVDALAVLGTWTPPSE